MDRWKRLALLSGFALATTGLVAPAISAQGGRNWLGLPLGPTQLRPATAGLQARLSGRPASPAAKLLRQQGYLVPNQALYRAKLRPAPNSKVTTAGTRPERLELPTF